MVCALWRSSWVVRLPGASSRFRFKVSLHLCLLISYGAKNPFTSKPSPALKHLPAPQGRTPILLAHWGAANPALGPWHSVISTTMLCPSWLPNGMSLLAPYSQPTYRLLRVNTPLFLLRTGFFLWMFYFFSCVTGRVNLSPSSSAICFKYSVSLSTQGCQHLAVLV